MICVELSAYDKLTSQEIALAYETMRHAYAITEREIWGENYSRISQEEYIQLIKNNEIFIARVDGKIAGSVAFKKQKEDTYSFGLLSAREEYTGLGIGRALIAAVENYAMKDGAHFISIEILKPRDYELPFKKVLHEWYERLGYVYNKSFSFLELKPDKIEKAKSLKVPVVFDCYSKTLS